jgi:hypothetical protein
MARTATLEEMRDRAYQRGGYESAVKRFPEAEVNGLINESIADLWDQLLRVRGVDSFETITTITTVAGTSVYGIPAGFYELLAVSVNAGNGLGSYPVERFMMKERPGLANPAIPRYGYPYFYKLLGQNIELLPIPQGAYSVEVRYVPTATELAADSDTFDGVNGWEEWVVVDVARKMATKERDWEQLGALQADLRRLEDRIRALGGARDRASNRRVVDVRGGRGRWMGRRRCL